MKILFLTNKVPYPPKDGGAIASLAMVNSFALAGHETTVLAMNTLKHHITPFEIPGEITNRTIFHLVEVPAPVTVKGALSNLFFSGLPYNAERFIDKKYRKKLELLLTKNEYDIIQLEGLYLIPYIPVIRKFSKSIIAYRSHNIEHEIWERTYLNSKGLKKIYLRIITQRMARFESQAINQYDLLVPITSRDALKLEKMGNKKPALVIPAGIDIDSTYKHEPVFESNVFYIGALDWTPNQEGLLWFIDNCLPSITKKHPTVRLKIAGRNAPDWLVKKFYRDNIDYLGEIDDASRFMKNNAVMIVPLFSGSGMRVKIIEGMSLAKAIVTTPIGVEGIDAENGKSIFIAGNPADFSNYVISLLNNEALIKQMGECAFQFVRERYSNHKLIGDLADFYKKHIE